MLIVFGTYLVIALVIFLIGGIGYALNKSNLKCRGMYAEIAGFAPLWPGVSAAWLILALTQTPPPEDDRIDPDRDDHQPRRGST